MRTRVGRVLMMLMLSGCHEPFSAGRQNSLPDMAQVGIDTGDMAMDYSGLDVEPSDLQTLNYPAQTSQAFMATLLGTPILVRWTVDRGDIGTIDSGQVSSATFTANGKVGGLVTVIASIGGATIKRQVMVKITAGPQNGVDTSVASEQPQVPANVDGLSKGDGLGGVGGVGGEGLGIAVSDPSVMTALESPTGDGASLHLSFLYPYDKTAWPRGMIAPLLMWNWDTGDADAIKIDLSTTSGSFTWSGTFGRPAILAQTSGKFIRHPIPQDVWEAATNSSGGPTPDGTIDKLTVKLTLARAGQAYGPLTETWTVAPARLTGTVYYNSYGTQLVKNFVTPDTAGHYFGAAVLGIRSGQTKPTLVVGADSDLDVNGHPTSDKGCRTCHVVASRGQRLIVQAEYDKSNGSISGGNPNYSYAYDLKVSNVMSSEKQLTPDGTFAWAGMVSDGSYAVGNAVELDSDNPSDPTNAGSGSAVSAFWQFALNPQMITNSGFPGGVGVAHPSFSPDDSLIAYVDVSGKTNNLQGPLMVGHYVATPSPQFSNFQALLSPGIGQRIGFPVFLPDNSGIVFETQLRDSNRDIVMTTRQGTRGEISWLKLGGASPTAVQLDALNGKNGSSSYLPVSGNDHGIVRTGDGGYEGTQYNEAGWDDTTLNYEPTILPIVSGGYAWIVFTSRRAYGNQLTATPWQSDPQRYDITDLSKATTKKLWVAAVSLGGSADADPSFPAFYLPAQEILTGNSRGFWALDPCQSDGNSCDTGDQCCGGCCQPNGAGGALICQSPPPDGHCSAVANCSQAQEKCVTSADCCEPSNTCVNGFCAQTIN